MISLDEQIAYVKQWHTGNKTTDSIFLSLRRLKRIEELMREPSEEICDSVVDGGDWRGAYADLSFTTPRLEAKNAIIALSAALLKQVEEEVK
jgi:hypothetical protein